MPAIIEEALDALIAPIARQPVEFGVIVYIGAGGRLAGLRHVRGRRDGVDLPIRLIVADALAFDATSVIVAHNHPSGDPAASGADLALTRRLSRGLDAIGVRLIDHIVIAARDRSSLREAGRL